MDFSDIRYEVADHVATITLNRPDARNALTFRTYDELVCAFETLQLDPEVRAVILTGEDPAFCSGDDVKQIMSKLADEPENEKPRVVRHGIVPATKTVLECDRPIVCAVNGAAVGWGMELSLYCDIRIASERAKFSELFIKRGLIPDVGGLQRLPQIVGLSNAARMLYTGDVIDAHEAERIGLVSQVVAHEDLLDAARALAGRIAENAPLPLRYIKEGVQLGRHATLQEMGGFCGGAWETLRQTEDHQEGIASFFEKRAPVFRGR